MEVDLDYNPDGPEQPDEEDAAKSSSVTTSKFSEETKKKIRLASSGDDCWHCGYGGLDVAHIIPQRLNKDVSKTHNHVHPRTTSKLMKCPISGFPATAVNRNTQLGPARRRKQWSPAVPQLPRQIRCIRSILDFLSRGSSILHRFGERRQETAGSRLDPKSDDGYAKTARR